MDDLAVNDYSVFVGLAARPPTRNELYGFGVAVAYLGTHRERVNTKFEAWRDLIATSPPYASTRSRSPNGCTRYACQRPDLAVALPTIPAGAGSSLIDLRVHGCTDVVSATSTDSGK
ncbi:hypothetical protein [Streptomyces sp. NPDC044948]|uniref:hypothetical protein n=1 Tax=Streptomyces sp. NPDC044948 TaxID=3157092 RepID=UPI00340AA532